MSSNEQGPEAAGLRVIDKGRRVRGKQGHIYEQAISAEAVGSRNLHMQLLMLPPGEVGRAHKHESHETAIYVLRGVSGVWWGDDLQHHETAGAGQFVYIAADVPHLPYNRSDSEPCSAVIARTDANEQESVVLLPELEARWRERQATKSRLAPVGAHREPASS